MAVTVVLYRNGTRKVRDITFETEDDARAFLHEQKIVMAEAGFRVEGGEDFINLYPPPDSLSDGSYSTFSLI